MEELQKTAWVVSQANYDREVELHAYSERERLSGSIFQCTAFDARSLHYNMEDVTGLNYPVIATLLNQKAFAAALRELIIEIETFSMNKVNLVCAGGTHRSVGTALILMLTTFIKRFWTAERLLRRGRKSWNILTR